MRRRTRCAGCGRGNRDIALWRNADGHHLCDDCIEDEQPSQREAWEDICDLCGEAFPADDARECTLCRLTTCPGCGNKHDDITTWICRSCSHEGSDDARHAEGSRRGTERVGDRMGREDPPRPATATLERSRVRPSMAEAPEQVPGEAPPLLPLPSERTDRAGDGSGPHPAPPEGRDEPHAQPPAPLQVLPQPKDGSGEWDQPAPHTLTMYAIIYRDDPVPGLIRTFSTPPEAIMSRDSRPGHLVRVSIAPMPRGRHPT